MKPNKKIMLFIFFLIGISLSSFVLFASSISSPQLTSPGAGSFGYLGRQGIDLAPIFNADMCNAGQDFIIQIPPFGCTPAVVRSDLLEEQNVPVFCQLSAIKLNPLIEVEAIDSLSFSGNYPEGIQGIGFHPARAAVRSTPYTLLNSPILQNIGYAVILLKQQPNESSMPDVISGNVTARIRYDVKNAFGIGKATQYLPEFTEDEWSNSFRQYSFWDGRGFLRAESIEADRATISIYLDENNKHSTQTLQIGGVSGDIYLPGFSCLAGLQLRLDGLKNPDTLARFNINGEIVQVAKNERFLDNKCSLRNVEKMGLAQKTDIVCTTDGGGERFNLIVSPKIKLNINGEEREAGVGDYLYEGGGKFVYLGYVGTKGNDPSLENLFVYLFSMPTKVDRLSESELLSISRLANNLKLYNQDEVSRVTSIAAINALASGAKAYIGLANQYKKYLVDGKDISYLEYGSEANFEAVVKISNFATPINQEITKDSFRINFENAMEDYRRIISSFPNEKQRTDDLQTFGQRALIEAMNISYKTQQKRTLLDLCTEFKEKYPDNKADVNTFCEDDYKLSSSEASEHSISVNGRIKSISLEGVYEPSFGEYGAEILVRDKDGKINPMVLRKNEIQYLDDSDTEFIQLENLETEFARVRVNLNPKIGVETIKQQVLSDTGNLRLNEPQAFGSNYIFTLTNVNLEKVAQVSVLPNIRDAGTETNFSFNVGIEKRAIQLSPGEIEKRLNTLNESIERWQDNSEKLGNAVRGFNAACLAVGTTLTIKNLISDFDGRAIARQEVMRRSGGWYDICKEKVVNQEFVSVDSCLLQNSDKVDADVDFVENVIKNQEGITAENIGTKLPQIRTLLGNRASDPDVSAVLTEQGYKDGKISLSQARDLERLATILNSNPSPELNASTEPQLNRILNDIKVNAQNFAVYSSLSEDAKKAGIPEADISYAVDPEAITGLYYNGWKRTTNQISCSGENCSYFEPGNAYSAKIQGFGADKYLFILDAAGGTTYGVARAFKFEGFSSDGKVVVSSLPNQDITRQFSYKFADSTSYNNRYMDPKLRFFETEPYKGLPALVPFDTQRGFYVATKQTIPGAGALRDSSIRAYDDSGRVNSFSLCNVGPNKREEFNSPSTGDDECMGFTPGLTGTGITFPGLTPSQTDQLLIQAQNAIREASSLRQRNPNLRGEVSILNNRVQVGPPEVGLPSIQCQDFMSPDDCHILFNTCDPVVCPSSRCDFGGSYPVDDVIQSGIVGSTLLCLPNIQEEIYVPICLTGVKAGIDGLISVQENYRDCLQTNLDTGKTVGICDEIHSIYLCDFFWSQTLPLSQVLVPKALEYVSGQTGRGGGEYLGVATAWKNAGDSQDFLTNYYGANSFEAFRTGVVNEVKHAFCKNFISTAYPDVDFMDSILEPESPSQYTAWFSERSFSTATVPPISQYKVFYHIFAGQNEGTYFSVYLKSPSGTSFFASNPIINVANGFIPAGDFASETRDFTAVSGYKELCVNVNGQEECGFNQVSTDFGLDYLQDRYSQEQGSQTDIRTENECVSGTPSLYSLATPNLQAGVENIINPSGNQIVRVCSTSNPERGTDPRAGTPDGRWVEVGTCDDGVGNLKCYLDQNSVKDAIKFASIENETLSDIERDTLAKLRREGQYINIGEELSKINKLTASGKVNYINQNLIDRALLSSEKATLYLIRGNAYAELAFREILENLAVKAAVKAIKSTEGINPDDFFDDDGTRTGAEQTPTPAEVTSGTTPDTIEVALDSAILELDQLVRVKGGAISYNSQDTAFKNFVDKIYLEGILRQDEYEDFRNNPATISDDAFRLNSLLREKRASLTGVVKGDDQCVEGAKWVDRSLKPLPSETTPGTAYIEITLKGTIDDCRGYRIAIVVPDTLLSNEYEVNTDKDNKNLINGKYYHRQDLKLVKEGGITIPFTDVNVFGTAKPAKFEFDILDAGRNEIFEGPIITVSETAESIFGIQDSDIP